MFNNRTYRWLKRRDFILVMFLFAVALLILIFNLRSYFHVKQPDLTLLEDYKGCMDSLSEAVIPETETPGATSAGVSAVVLKLVQHCLTLKEQNTFLNGMQELDKYCLGKYGNVFKRCSQTQQIERLYQLENNANMGGRFVTKVRQKLFGKSFIHLVKELCVIGYCTSFKGATEGLAYDGVPGSYQGCVLLNKNQHSWATT